MSQRNGRPAELAALFGLAQRLGQRFGVDWRRVKSNQTMLDPCAHSFIGSDVAVADDPEVERPGLLMRCGGLRGGPDHGVARLKAPALRSLRRPGEFGASMFPISSLWETHSYVCQ